MLRFKISALFLALMQTSLAFEDFAVCLNNGNYTTNSTYAVNLNTLLSSLPQNIGVTGFHNASVGSQDPDRANAIALCRGDLLQTVCRECIQNLTTSVPRACPNQRQAVHWSEFCMLRYSNETVVGTLATRPGIYLQSLFNATRPTQYMADVRSLLDSLRGPAAGGGPLRKVAARNATAPDAQHIFGMLQCTPDLSSDDCSSCLSEASSAIPDDGRIGVRVNLPSCTLRFENSSFYNDTRLQELGALAPESPLAPAPSSSPLPSPSPLSSLPSPSSSPLPSPPSPPPSSPSQSPLPSPPPASPPPPAGIAGTNGGSNTTRDVCTILVSIAACAILSFWI